MIKKITQWKCVARLLVSTLLLSGVAIQASFSQKTPYAGERIILSVDGNEHSKNDWGATPLSLALFAAYGLQDQVVVYSFSGHTWGSNKVYPGSVHLLARNNLVSKRPYSLRRLIHPILQSLRLPNKSIRVRIKTHY
jgi:hypothetical protein